MGSAWIEDPKIDGPEDYDKFMDFVQLYDAYMAGKSASPERLQLRVDKIWGDLRIETKKDWTYRLIKLNKLDENLARTIEFFHRGIIIKFYTIQQNQNEAFRSVK